MIYAKDAPEIACLKRPDLLLEMTRAGVERTLGALEHAEWADSYSMERAPVPALVPRHRTLLAKMIGVLRMGLAEWPSNLAALVALMLNTKTSIPSDASIARWDAMRRDGAFRHLTRVLIRTIETATTGLKNAWLVPEKFSAWRQAQYPELKGWAANPDVWAAGRAVFTSALWLLAFDTDPKTRSYLADLCESESWVRHDCSATLYWALARPADEHALKLLKPMLTPSLDSKRQRMLARRIGEVEDALGSGRPASQLEGVDRKARWRLDSLVSSGYEIVANEARSLLALADIAGLGEIVDLLMIAEGSKPSKAWLTKRGRVLERNGSPALRAALIGVIDAYDAITVVRPLLSMQEFDALDHFRKTGAEQPGNPAARGIAERERERARVFGTYVPGIGQLGLIASSLARGAHWTLAAIPDEELVDRWCRTVLAWSRMGDPNPTIAYAAMHALSNADPEIVSSRLQELRLRIRHKNLAKRIAASFEAVAKGRGLSSEDLADELVSDHGLDDKGVRAWAVGDCRVLLRLDDDGSVALAYEGPDGKARTSLPKDLADADPEALKAAKAERKAVAATMTQQKGRLETAMVDGRRWTAGAWSKSFGRHPLLSRLARRLVWRIESAGRKPVLAIPDGRAWHDADGSAVPVKAVDGISLPHPVQIDDTPLVRWRSLLIESRIVQPFKQAFRETYRPSEVEVERLACDRFSGFTVPLSTVRALLAPRGWTGGFGLSGFDGAGRGERVFSSPGIRASFTHGDVEAQLAILETIQFYPHEGAEPLRIGDVPLIPFSEALRDMDLVASAALAMAAEKDVLGSAHAAIASAIGLTRAPIVRQVIAGSGFGDRVTFEGSHATVDGTHRVHLGTGVVVRLGKNESVRLPFNASTLKGLRLPVEGDDPIARLVATIATLLRDKR